MAEPITIDFLQPPGATDQQHAELFALYGELTSRELDPAEVRNNIEAVIANPLQWQIVAEQAGAIVGAATFSVHRAPTLGEKGLIDDVVVTRKARGQGIGRQLLLPIIDIADEAGIILDLTSNDSRKIAIDLYKKLGFVKRDTNFMRREPQPRE